VSIRRDARKRSELKTAIGLVAFGASPLLYFASQDVKMIAAEAAKRGATAFTFEAGMVSAVVVKPETEEERGDQKTINDGGDLQTHEKGLRKEKDR
jgi:hypothetical protein